MNDETIVVGWTPDPYGRAAVSAAVAEAALGATGWWCQRDQGRCLRRRAVRRGQRSPRAGERGRRHGVSHEVRQMMGVDVAEQVLAVADEVSASLIVIGLRRRTPVGKLLWAASPNGSCWAPAARPRREAPGAGRPGEPDSAAAAAARGRRFARGHPGRSYS